MAAISYSPITLFQRKMLTVQEIIRIKTSKFCQIHRQNFMVFILVYHNKA